MRPAGVAALVGVFGLIFTLIPATPISQAATPSAWDPGFIISDPVFYDSGSMSGASVDTFLRAKGAACVAGEAPCLKDYRENTRTIAGDQYCSGYAGRPQETAGQIIATVATSCGINPEVLIVLLEKENSLVSKTRPTARNYQAATGFGCPDTAPCNTEYFGFQNQVFRAARQYKVYAANPTRYGYQAGRTNTILFNPNTSCGSAPVYIRNQATASLYNYTPYQPNAAALANLYGSGDACSAYGNRNFWRIFTDWFGDPQHGGFMIKSASSSAVYLVVGAVKYTVPDWSTYLNYAALGPIATVSNAQVNGYPTAGTLGRFVRDGGSGAIYLVSGGTKYMATSCGQVADFGGSCAGPLINLENSQLNLLGTGPLLQNVVALGDGRVYFVRGGQRHEVFDDPSLQWAGISIARVVLPAGTFDDLPITNPIVRDDVLIRVRGTGAAYLWTGGRLYPVPQSAVGFPGLSRYVYAGLDAPSLAGIAVAPGTPGVVSRAGVGTALVTDVGLVQLDVVAAGGAPPAAVSIPVSLFDSFPRVDGRGAAMALKTASDSTVLRLAGGTARPADTWQDLVHFFGNRVPPIRTVARETLAAFPRGPGLITPGTFVKVATSPEIYLVDSESQLVFVDSMATLSVLGRSFRTAGPSALTSYPVAAAPLQSLLRCSGMYRAGVGGQIRSLAPPAEAGALPATPLTDSCAALTPQGSVLAGPVFVKAPNEATVFEIVGGSKRAFTSWEQLMRRAGASTPVIYTVSASVLARIPAVS